MFTEELTNHLTHILEKQKIETVKPAKKTADEKARKQAILAQYGQISSGDEYPLYNTLAGFFLVQRVHVKGLFYLFYTVAFHPSSWIV